MVRASPSLIAALPILGAARLHESNETGVRALQDLSLARTQQNNVDLILPVEPFRPAEFHAALVPERDPKADAVFLTDRAEAAIGFSYGPLPVKRGISTGFYSDDMTSYYFKGQWSREGRNDLKVMHDLGAKMVRLYGKDPNLPSMEFLDTANSFDMRVVAGVSGYPYEQGAAEKCRIRPDAHTDMDNSFDCYEGIQEWYTNATTSGNFLIPKADGTGSRYHPALDTLILLNEPELKYFIYDAGNRRPQNVHYMKAFLSALDAILSVEMAAGIDYTSKEGNIRFTVAFSYGTCGECPSYELLNSVETDGGEVCCCVRGTPNCPSSMECVGNPTSATGCPGLAPMMDLWQAVQDPSSVHYTFLTPDWRTAFDNRFVFSVNAFVEAEPFKAAFLEQFVNMPFQKVGGLADGEKKPEDEMFKVMLGEYGNQHVAKNPIDLQSDLEAIVEVANDHPFFIGVNFFQFAVAYWKSCAGDDNDVWDDWQQSFWDAYRDGEQEGWEENWLEKAADNGGWGSGWSNVMATINGPDNVNVVCHEREFGLFAFGDLTVSQTMIQDENERARAVQCLAPFVPLKVQAVANALLGEEGAPTPDMSLCEYPPLPQNRENYCIASRGAPDFMIQELMDVVTCADGACDAGAPPFDLTHHNELMAAMPEVCNENVWSKGDYFFSSLIEHGKQNGFFNDDFHPWDYCYMSGGLVFTPYAARPECTFKTYRTMPVDGGVPSGPAPPPTPAPPAVTPAPPPPPPTLVSFTITASLSFDPATDVAAVAAFKEGVRRTLDFLTIVQQASFVLTFSAVPAEGLVGRRLQTSYNIDVTIPATAEEAAGLTAAVTDVTGAADLPAVATFSENLRTNELATFSEAGLPEPTVDVSEVGAPTTAVATPAPSPAPVPGGATTAAPEEAGFLSTPAGMAVAGVGGLAVVCAIGYGAYMAMGGGQTGAGNAKVYGQMEMGNRRV